MANLQQELLIDDYAEGKDTGIIDLVLIGDIDKANSWISPQRKRAVSNGKAEQP